MAPSQLLLVMKEREGGRESEGEERGTRKTEKGRKGTEDIDRLGDRRKGEEEAVGIGSPRPVREKVISSFPESTDWSVVTDSTVLSIQGSLVCHGEQGEEEGRGRKGRKGRGSRRGRVGFFFRQELFNLNLLLLSGKGGQPRRACVSCNHTLLSFL